MASLLVSTDEVKRHFAHGKRCPREREHVRKTLAGFFRTESSPNTLRAKHLLSQVPNGNLLKSQGYKYSSCKTERLFEAPTVLCPPNHLVSTDPGAG